LDYCVKDSFIGIFFKDEYSDSLRIRFLEKIQGLSNMIKFDVPEREKRDDIEYLFIYFNGITNEKLFSNPFKIKSIIYLNNSKRKYLSLKILK
jgi:hypothetical protein